MLLPWSLTKTILPCSKTLVELPYSKIYLILPVKFNHKLKSVILLLYFTMGCAGHKSKLGEVLGRANKVYMM